MSLELDHVFCFCAPSVPEAQLVESLGFMVLPERIHQGQGTANRAVVFEENYLEFIYLSSKEESQKNELELYQRADWKNTMASPFGIALRGTILEKDKIQFWEYKPPYAKGKSIFIHKYNQEHPEAPLLFVMSLPDGVSLDQMRPDKSPTLDRSFLKHNSGSTGIRRIQVSSPIALPDLFNVSAIEVEVSLDPYMCVELDGTVAPVDVSSILSLKA